MDESASIAAWHIGFLRLTEWEEVAAGIRAILAPASRRAKSRLTRAHD